MPFSENAVGILSFLREQNKAIEIVLIAIKVIEEVQLRRYKA